MSFNNSDQIRQQLRLLLKDSDPDIGKRRWSEEEIDASLTDGFGVVTYGARTEGTNGLDNALAKMYAGAQLALGLARDRARLKRWKSAAGEEVESQQEAERLESLARAWMEQVNKALTRDIERNKEGASKSTQAEGGTVTWNTISPTHRNFKFGKVNNIFNKPADRA